MFQMFASLFPLAPLLALIIGFVDMRIDAHRLIWFNRKPIPIITNGKIYGISLEVITKLVRDQEHRFLKKRKSNRKNRK